MKVTYHYSTGMGHRSANQDCIGMKKGKNGYLFAVADGIGKMPYGALASKIVLETVLRIGDKEEPCKRFTRQYYQLAERMLQRTAEMEHYQEGSLQATMATLQLNVRDECFYIGHQGDCRVYVFRSGEVFVKTKDHSIAQRMVEQGLISETQVSQIPEKKQLTRILGAGQEKVCDATEAYALMDQMCFLICTDGFWNEITDEEIQALLQESNSVKEWLDQMLSVVNSRGNQKQFFDNYSAIAVWINEK